MRPAIPPPLSSVYTWGGGLSAPLRLPMLNTAVVQVAAGRTQKAGVTRSGRLILWEVSRLGRAWSGGRVTTRKGALRSHSLPPLSPPQAPPLGAGGGALLPGAVEQQQPQFVSRFLEGQSGVTIKQVACGDLFTACLTGEPVRRLPCGDPTLRRPPRATSLFASHLQTAHLIMLLSTGY